MASQGKCKTPMQHIAQTRQQRNLHTDISLLHWLSHLEQWNLNNSHLTREAECWKAIEGQQGKYPQPCRSSEYRGTLLGKSSIWTQRYITSQVLLAVQHILTHSQGYPKKHTTHLSDLLPRIFFISPSTHQQFFLYSSSFIFGISST